MVVYTPGARVNMGGVAGVTAWIDAAIAHMNVTLINSKTFVNMQPVLIREIPYTDTNNSATDLNRLANTVDGFLDQVVAWSITYPSNHIMLVTGTPYGGRASLPGRHSVVGAGPDGGIPIIVAHEIGHNFGLHHGPETGVTSYARGYTFNAAGLLMGDVMSYSGEDILNYSNPFVLFMNVPTGRLIGTAGEADGAQVIRDTTAWYTPGTANLPPTLSLDGPLDGLTMTTLEPLTITVTASDPDGSVFKVEYFANNVPIGSTLAAPHVLVVDPIAVGTYAIHAVATDNQGAKAFSCPVTITVRSSLPVPWTEVGVGVGHFAGLFGRITYSGGQFEIIGSGGGWVEDKNAFDFAHQPFCGNGTISARVDSLALSPNTGRTGVMLRLDTRAEAPYMSVELRATGGLSVNYRTVAGAAAVQLTAGSGNAPRWVRIERSGNIYRPYWSVDGISWNLIGTGTLAIPALAGTLLAGPYASGGKFTANTYAVLSSLTLADSAPCSPSPTPTVSATSQVPPEWAGWTSEGDNVPRWHLVEDGVHVYANSRSPTTAYWFGSDSSGNYDYGDCNGTLTSPWMQAGPQARLRYGSWMKLGTGEQVNVLVERSLQPGWTPVVGASVPTSPSVWQAVDLDLAQAGVDMVRFQFVFRSDLDDNAHRGWYIDDVSLFVPTPTVTPSYCPTPTSSPTATITPTFSASPTASPSATISPTPSISPTVTLTGTVTPTRPVPTPGPGSLLYAYPQPLSGARVTLVFPELSASEAVILVYNARGELAVTLRHATVRGRSNEVSWDVSAWANGIYFAVVKAGDQRLGPHKFLVNRP